MLVNIKNVKMLIRARLSVLLKKRTIFNFIMVESKSDFVDNETFNVVPFGKIAFKDNVYPEIKSILDDVMGVDVGDITPHTTINGVIIRVSKEEVKADPKIDKLGRKLYKEFKVMFKDADYKYDDIKHMQLGSLKLKPFSKLDMLIRSINKNYNTEFERCLDPRIEDVGNFIGTTSSFHTIASRILIMKKIGLIKDKK